MSRPSREWTYIEIAKIISKRGTCKRMQVGCVITKNNRIISTGYNGPLQTEIPCERHCDDLQEPCHHAIHAETNAIMSAAQLGISLFMATLYCTHQPCESCARMIVQAGIGKVIYEEPYRLNIGLEVLRRAKIEVEKYVATQDNNRTLGS